MSEATAHRDTASCSKCTSEIPVEAGRFRTDLPGVWWVAPVTKVGSGVCPYPKAIEITMN